LTRWKSGVGGPGGTGLESGIQMRNCECDYPQCRQKWGYLWM